MTKYTRLDGTNYSGDCLSCCIINNKIPSFVERLYETKNFVVEQDFAHPIPGFLIIATKRHIQSIIEFNEEEIKDYTNLIIKTVKIMSKYSGCNHITQIQEEKSYHYHLWLFPFQEWMEKTGNKLNDIVEILRISRTNYMEESLQKEVIHTADEIRRGFSNS